MSKNSFNHTFSVHNQDKSNNILTCEIRELEH